MYSIYHTTGCKGPWGGGRAQCWSDAAINNAHVEVSDATLQSGRRLRETEGIVAL
eukprot:COSAG05_NODE_1020_length_6147_cov_4.104828_4_plen_55_part_00